MTAEKERRGQEEREPHYVNVLTLAVARTSHDRFLADSIKWMQVVREGKDVLSDDYPKLLSGVSFEHFSGGRFWSDDVEQFLSIMRRSRILRQLGPDMREYLIDPKAKRELEEGHNPALDKFNKPLEVITSLIDENLGIPREQYS